MTDLREIDFNLLSSLKVLLEERHVTRAAERVGISQPAMSAALARARVLFGDPLLVRGSKGLALTPRAERVLEQLGEVTSRVTHMLSLPTELVPATSTRKFSLIGTDFVEMLLLPRLLEALAVEAPGVVIIFRAPDFKNLERMMAEGELDLSVGYCPGAPELLMRKVVFEETFVCVSRAQHPRIGGHLSLERYIELVHIQTLPKGSAMYASLIDVALASMGLVRRIALWQPSFLAVAGVVAATDMVSTLPRRLAARVASCAQVDVHELPFELPSAEIALHWHARHQDDVGHRWFRHRVAELLREAAGDDARAGHRGA